MAESDDRHRSEGLEDLSETVEDRPTLPPGTGRVGATDSEFDLDADTEDLFRSSELFRGLTSDEVREIVRVSELTTIPAGEVLFSQGDEASALFIVESGELEVRGSTELGEEVVFAVLGSGTVVGEMALLEKGPRSATVEALSECSIFRLSTEAFNSLRERKRHSAYKLILNLAQTLGERRRQADRRVTEVFADPGQHIDAFETQVHEMAARMRKA